MDRAPHRNRHAHLCLRPHRSLFASKEQPAKASVVLKLRSNRQPANGTLHAIANLVWHHLSEMIRGFLPDP